MTGGALGGFSDALSGVTEAEVAAYDAQSQAVEQLDGPDVSNPEPSDALETAPSSFDSVVTQERVVADEVREAASMLLAGSMFETTMDPRSPMNMWVHTDDEVRQILFGDPLLIGRVAPAGDASFLLVSNDKVSREHCGIRVVDGRATCVDLGSTNGTWLIRGDEVIEVGDTPEVLEVGDIVCTMVNQVVLARLSGDGLRQ